MWTTIFELVCRTKSHIKQSYRSVFLKTVLKRRLTVACIALKKFIFLWEGVWAEKAIESQTIEEPLLLLAGENNMSGIQNMKKGHSNKDE